MVLTYKIPLNHFMEIVLKDHGAFYAKHAKRVIFTKVNKLVRNVIPIIEMLYGLFYTFFSNCFY